MLFKNIEIEVLVGMEGLKIILLFDEVDVFLIVVVGMIGLVLIFCVIKKGIDIVLVNKEMLVIVGEFVMKEVEKYNVNIFFVDSEYSVIF